MEKWHQCPKCHHWLDCLSSATVSYRPTDSTQEEIVVDSKALWKNSNENKLKEIKREPTVENTPVLSNESDERRKLRAKGKYRRSTQRRKKSSRAKEYEEKSAQDITTREIHNNDRSTSDGGELNSENECSNVCKSCFTSFETKRELEEHSNVCDGFKEQTSVDGFIRGEDMKTELDPLENNESPGNKVSKVKSPLHIKTFTSRRSLRKHAQRHDLLKYKHTCVVCKQLFSTKADLKLHVKTHKDHIFGCTKCDRMFTSETELQEHTVKHAAVCVICGKLFQYVSSLKVHMLLHTGEKPHKCELCGKQFNQRGSLRRHKESHAGEKTHMCTMCGSRFVHASGLSAHMKTHLEEKPHKCDECGRKFCNSYNLKVHIRQHTGELPFKCDKCGKGFKQINTLKYHQRHANRLCRTVSEPEKLKRHECPVCKQRLWGHVKRHLVQKHSMNPDLSVAEFLQISGKTCESSQRMSTSVQQQSQEYAETGMKIMAASPQRGDTKLQCLSLNPVPQNNVDFLSSFADMSTVYSQ